jgi:cell shape-determining protein MreC
VLALLLIAILISTAFDREDGGGPLNSFKDGVTSLTGKVQDVAVGAARPFRDGWNWFGDISSVRGERDRLRDEVERLRGELAGRQVDNERLDELEELLSLQSETPEGYSPTAANILTRPLVDVAREARIDKGTNQGVTVNSLVFAPTGDDVPSQYFGALIGRVTRVNADTADVVFLTSNTTSIAAKTLLGINLGLLKANSLGELRVEGIPTSAAISENMIVVTQGVGTDNLLSPYPQGIPIGYISSFGGAESGGDWTVQVTPFADPNTLRTVMIYIPRTAIAKRRAGLR